MLDRKKTISELVSIHEYLMRCAPVQYPGSVQMWKDWERITADAVNLLAKDIPQKPFAEKYCPSCGEELNPQGGTKCPVCGQVVNWNEVDG